MHTGVGPPPRAAPVARTLHKGGTGRSRRGGTALPGAEHECEVPPPRGAPRGRGGRVGGAARGGT
eukprot:152699-Chlamydomonas_euryale.AAC.1